MSREVVNSLVINCTVDAPLPQRNKTGMKLLCQSLERWVWYLAMPNCKIDSVEWKTYKKLREENIALRRQVEQLRTSLKKPETECRQPEYEYEETGYAGAPAAPSSPESRHSKPYLPPPGFRRTEARSQSAGPLQEKTRQFKKEDAPQKWILKNCIQEFDHAAHTVDVCLETNTMAAASWDASILLYDIQRSKMLSKYSASTQQTRSGLYAVAFSKVVPDFLACACQDNTVWLYSIPTNSVVANLTGHTSEVNGVIFHPSQQILASCSDDMSCRVWDFEERKTLRNFNNHKKEVYGATFFGQTQEYLVATTCFDRITRVFDMREGKTILEFNDHTDDVIGIDYSPHHNCMVTGSDDGWTIFYDTRMWKRLFAFDTKCINASNEIKRVKFSPDGSLCAAGSSYFGALVISMTRAVQLAQQSGGDCNFTNADNILVGKLHDFHNKCVFDVAWTADNSLFTASHDQLIGEWEYVGAHV